METYFADQICMPNLSRVKMFFSFYCWSEGRDSLPLLYPCPPVLLGVSPYETRGPVEMSPEEDCKDDQKAGAPLQWREAEN